MVGPSWNHDDQDDLARIDANCQRLLTGLLDESPTRLPASLSLACEWHRIAYEGCRVPLDTYVGNFRGDADHPELVGYEVGLGHEMSDGLPEKVGVWSDQVADELATFDRRINAALRVLDDELAVGSVPESAAALHEVVAVAALAHGEWVRIHPFANGNGRTARIWAAFVTLRYGLPVLARLRPRPDGVTYVRAAQQSMGRPPDFVGDHGASIAVFVHSLDDLLHP